MTAPLSLFDGGINEQVLKIKVDTIFRMMDELPLAAWMCTPDAKSFWCNREWRRYSGTTMEHMREWCWQDFYHLDDMPRIANSFCTSLKTEQPWQDFFLLRRYDGGYYHHLGRSVPIRESGGALLYWLVYFIPMLR